MNYIFGSNAGTKYFIGKQRGENSLPRRLFSGLILPVLVFCLPVGLFAAEAHRTCMYITFQGVSPALRGAIETQLKYELSIRIVSESSRDSCVGLHVKLHRNTVNVSLHSDTTYTTEFNLGDIEPSYWPVAITLSTAGLISLFQYPKSSSQQNNMDRQAEASDVSDTKKAAGRRAEKKSGARQDQVKRENVGTRLDGHNVTSVETAVSTEKANRPPRLRHGLHAGGRVVPRYPNWIGEAAWHLAILTGKLYPELAILGIGGQKTVDLGRIVTAGVGIRLTAWWQMVSRTKLRIRLGATVETIGVWGIGIQELATSSRFAFHPVIDLMMLLAFAFPISADVNVSLLLGGGWFVLGYEMQEANQDAAGLSGGVISMNIGIEFNIH
jgi:hypothetical protein